MQFRSPLLLVRRLAAPQARHHLLHPPLLLPDLLLRLPSRVPAAVDLHPLAVLLLLLLDDLVPVDVLGLGVDAHDAVHHEGAALAQLVDGAHGVDGAVQGAPRVEVLLDRGEQVLAGAELALAARGVGRVQGRVDPGVLQGLVRGDALFGVDGQAAVDELAGRLRDAAPVLLRGVRVVGRQDGLHLLQVGLAVEGGVAAEEEVGDDADGPDVSAPRKRMQSTVMLYRQ